MKVLIKNGLVINPKTKFNKKANIVIEAHNENSKISSINDKEIKDYDHMIDASGMIVSPGFVDIHTNFCEPGFENKENFSSFTVQTLHSCVVTIEILLPSLSLITTRVFT